MHYIIGDIIKINYRNDSYFTIAKFMVIESDLPHLVNHTITIKGNIIDKSEHELYKITGSIEQHSKFGEQFVISAYEIKAKSDENSIVNFLSSAPFVGIGRTKAKKIYDYFKDETLDIIKTNPEKLKLIDGISTKNINILHQTLLEQLSTYEDIIFLESKGFSNKEALTILFNYSNIKDLINNDAYELYIKYGFSLSKIDKLVDYPITDIRRTRAYLLSILRKDVLTGNLFLSKSILYENFIKNMDISINDFDKVIENLVESKLIVNDNDNIYLKENYADEILIAEEVAYRIKNPIKITNKKLLENLNKVEESTDIKYNLLQKEAIIKSMFSGILIITGGPGVGKTTVMKGISSALELQKLSFKLLSPTGRAAKRMSELSGKDASTIHSYLEWNKENDSFRYNEFNKHKEQVIVIDEFSMVDNSLFASLLRSLPLTTRIIIIGDKDQLPSIRGGNVLKSLLSHVDVVEFKELYRQQKKSNITRLAVSLNYGRVEIVSGEDLDIIDDNILEKIVDLYDELNINYKDIQVLVPLYKGSLGIDNLNILIRDRVNPKTDNKKEFLHEKILYREGDKIIQLVNDTNLEIYNGDIGIISDFDKNNIYLDFDGRTVKVSKSALNINLAYVISIHKSQGSEFKYVFIPLSMNYSPMIYRALYYTAITRCKEHLYLFGDIDVLSKAADNNKEEKRNTLLEFRLQKELDK